MHTSIKERFTADGDVESYVRVRLIAAWVELLVANGWNSNYFPLNLN